MHNSRRASLLFKNKHCVENERLVCFAWRINHQVEVFQRSQMTPMTGASVLPPLPHTVGDPVLRLNHFGWRTFTSAHCPSQLLPHSFFHYIKEPTLGLLWNDSHYYFEYTKLTVFQDRGKCFSWWFSKCGFGPAASAPLGNLLQRQLLSPAGPKM